MTGIVAMSQSCSRCGATVTNDDLEIHHPLEFLQALRERGWTVSENKPGLCPKCTPPG